MIPKQIRISANTNRFLKQRARELGVSESSVVRQALDSAAKHVASEWLHDEVDGGQNPRIKPLDDLG
jgi:hypothetical protein